jgi:hypothetical protein
MAPVNRIDSMRASPSAPPHHDQTNEPDDPFGLDDFDEELRRLSAVNQALLDGLHEQDDDSAVANLTPASSAVDTEEIERLRQENAELRLRVEALESLGAGKGEELWLERQREYEVLLEEKSEVIRSLHQKLQEAEECAIGGAPPTNSVTTSGTKLGQAEEIFRLKREMEEQRKQLAQDEEEMMAQMRQMELTMAKERAEMARQRQEVQRLQADLAREIENSSRDPELRERLQSLRRSQESKAAAPPAEKPATKSEQPGNGFLRSIFG